MTTTLMTMSPGKDHLRSGLSWLPATTRASRASVCGACTTKGWYVHTFIAVLAEIRQVATAVRTTPVAAPATASTFKAEPLAG